MGGHFWKPRGTRKQGPYATSPEKNAKHCQRNSNEGKQEFAPGRVAEKERKGGRKIMAAPAPSAKEEASRGKGSQEWGLGRAKRRICMRRRGNGQEKNINAKNKKRRRPTENQQGLSTSPSTR